MPVKDWKARLQDIIDAVTKIEHHTYGLTRRDAMRSGETTPIPDHSWVGEGLRFSFS